MKFLQSLFDNSLDSEESEDSGPETEKVFHFKKETTEEMTKKTARVRFTSGREEEITHHKYDQNGERRTYYVIINYKPRLMSTYSSYRPKMSYSYEEVKEVSMRNVETVEIIEEKTETFTGTLDKEYVAEECYSKKKKYLRDHEDTEVIEREVDDGIAG